MRVHFLKFLFLSLGLQSTISALPSGARSQGCDNQLSSCHLEARSPGFVRTRPNPHDGGITPVGDVDSDTPTHLGGDSTSPGTSNDVDTSPDTIHIGAPADPPSAPPNTNALSPDEQARFDTFSRAGTELNTRFSASRDQRGGVDSTYPPRDNDYHVFTEFDQPQLLRTTPDDLDELDDVFEHPEIKRLLGDDGIDTEYTKVSLVSNGQPDMDHTIFNQNAYSSKGDAIIATINYADQDTKKTLRWSELVWQTRALEGGAGDKLADLKVVIRHNIQNQETAEVVQLAHKDAGKTATESVEFVEGTPGFNALMATDNGKGVGWMVSDHYNAIGQQSIKKFITFPGNELHIAIILGT